MFAYQVRQVATDNVHEAKFPAKALKILEAKNDISKVESMKLINFFPPDICNCSLCMNSQFGTLFYQIIPFYFDHAKMSLNLEKFKICRILKWYCGDV